VKPGIKRVKELLGFNKETADLDRSLEIAGMAGKAFAAVVGVAGLALVAFGIKLAVAAAAVLAVPAAIFAVGFALGWLVGKAVQAAPAAYEAMTGWAKDAIDWLGKLPAKAVDLGKDIVMGYVKGVLSMGSAVKDAVVGVMSSASKSADKFLGRASPAKIFIDKGEDSGEGYAVGLRKSEPDVRSAVERVVSFTGSGNSGASDRGAEAGGSGLSSSINLAGAQFTFNGISSVENAVEMFEEALARVLRGDAQSAGGAA
jgi:hypothetical protein